MALIQQLLGLEDENGKPTQPKPLPDTRFQTSTGRLITRASASTGAGSGAKAKTEGVYSPKVTNRNNGITNNTNGITNSIEKTLGTDLPDWVVPAAIVGGITLVVILIIK